MALLPKRHTSASPPESLQSAALVDDRLFTDFYLNLLTASWPALLLQIVGAFFVINLIFALGYYLDGGIENARPDHFSDYFFFSVETIATIGYGKLAPTDLFSHILMSIEAVAGLINFALITGLIFAKFSRPTARVRFSRSAVISKRDGVPSLMFRMANVRDSNIVEAHIHVVFARDEHTREGEYVRRFYDLNLTRYRNAIFQYSWTAVHPIEPGSPFYGGKAEDLIRDDASITVSLSGVDETFSQTVYSRYSYKAEDIIWGARLADILSESAERGFRIDYSKFDDTEPTEAPMWTLESA
jgi:inward rectifier potassium channel